MHYERIFYQFILSTYICAPLVSFSLYKYNFRLTYYDVFSIHVDESHRITKPLFHVAGNPLPAMNKTELGQFNSFKYTYLYNYKQTTNKEIFRTTTNKDPFSLRTA